MMLFYVFKIMRTIIITAILSFILQVNAFGQNFNTEISYTTTLPKPEKQWIFYTPGETLSIEDFASTPVTSSEAVAITSSGFAFKAGYRNAAGKATLLITVYCTFDKNRSWMKDVGKNPYVLQHEQHHFDITYLATLEFIKQLQAAKFTNENYSRLLESIYNAATKNLEVMQNTYDNETSNGRLKDQQALWNKKVDQLLLQSAKR